MTRDEELKALVHELRDAAETALDVWTCDPAARAHQIGEAIDAAVRICNLVIIFAERTPPRRPS